MRAAAPKTEDHTAVVEKLNKRMDQASLARTPEGPASFWCGALTLLDQPASELGWEAGNLLGKMFAVPQNHERPHPRLLRFDRVRAERFMLVLADFLDQYPWAYPHLAGRALGHSREERSSSTSLAEKNSLSSTSRSPRRSREGAIELFKWADVLLLLIYGKAVVIETRRRLDTKIKPAVAILTLREALERLKPNVPLKTVYWQAWMELRAALEPQ